MGEAEQVEPSLTNVHLTTKAETSGNHKRESVLFADKSEMFKRNENSLKLMANHQWCSQECLSSK